MNSALLDLIYFFIVKFKAHLSAEWTVKVLVTVAHLGPNFKHLFKTINLPFLRNTEKVQVVLNNQSTAHIVKKWLKNFMVYYSPLARIQPAKWVVLILPLYSVSIFCGYWELIQRDMTKLLLAHTYTATIAPELWFLNPGMRRFFFEIQASIPKFRGRGRSKNWGIGLWSNEDDSIATIRYLKAVDRIWLLCSFTLLASFCTITLIHWIAEAGVPICCFRVFHF